jgi:hypothetical protein
METKSTTIKTNTGVLDLVKERRKLRKYDVQTVQENARSDVQA